MAVTIRWKPIFVSCPGDEALDQELDDCLVGPIPGAAPDPSRIPEDDVLGVAALILTGSYRDQEFVRVGYCQNTEYDRSHVPQRLVRDISAKPRVTRFHIKWDVSSPQPIQAALGAATSAPVPLADDINNGDDEMDADFSKGVSGS
ncbi:hypothetical protein HYPSUDRAFT_73177 [Hypholoma sublateritium FD-334 SS-4]|uniref:Anti-silencing function protein 1 n=1 Tax=Hypholoma sublateritium (strain FD-334 SS-4) TaxID=945553 RepID=A0A0D2LQ26_HYPSF|nr:hypothetical protein HYPSUDRAFT_73177 [Hypholoma sublateritium FD-334 SS-4]